MAIRAFGNPKVRYNAVMSQTGLGAAPAAPPGAAGTAGRWFPINTEPYLPNFFFWILRLKFGHIFLVRYGNMFIKCILEIYQ